MSPASRRTGACRTWRTRVQSRTSSGMATILSGGCFDAVALAGDLGGVRGWVVRPGWPTADRRRLRSRGRPGRSRRGIYGRSARRLIVDRFRSHRDERARRIGGCARQSRHRQPARVGNVVLPRCGDGPRVDRNHIRLSAGRTDGHQVRQLPRRVRVHVLGQPSAIWRLLRVDRQPKCVLLRDKHVHSWRRNV